MMGRLILHRSVKRGESYTLIYTTLWDQSQSDGPTSPKGDNVFSTNITFRF